MACVFTLAVAGAYNIGGGADDAENQYREARNCTGRAPQSFCCCWSGAARYFAAVVARLQLSKALIRWRWRTVLINKIQPTNMKGTGRW